MPILMPDGRIAVGTWCEHSYYYDPKDGKFYDSFMLNDGFGSCRLFETEPSPDNLEHLHLFQEGTYFDATSENQNDWHHKYRVSPEPAAWASGWMRSRVHHRSPEWNLLLSSGRSEHRRILP